MTQFFRQVFALLRPYRTRTILGIVSGFLAGVAEPLLLGTVMLVFKVVFPDNAGGQVDQQLGAWQERLPFLRGLFSWLQGVGHGSAAVKVFFISLIPLAMLFRGAIGYLNLYLMYWVSFRAMNDLRARVFRHVVGLPMGFFARHSSGDLMSRLNNDLAAVQTVMGNTLIGAIKNPVTLVAFMVYLVGQQPRLTFVSLLVFPLVLVPMIVFGRKLRKSVRAQQQHLGETVDLMQEAFSGIRAVKAYNLEPVVDESFVRTQARLFGQIMRVARASELPGPLTELVGSLGVGILLGYVALGYGGDVTTFDFSAFVVSISWMYRPVKEIARLVAQAQQAEAASRRVFELLETENSLPEPVRPKPLRADGAPIRFERLSFSYGDKQVLRDVDLTVEPGKMVALVGRSGSGKTTLTSLLLRFYDPGEGRITIGGTDLRDVASRDLRDQIAVVTQETILFNETIRRNIEMGRPGASDGEIEAAARAAHAHGFIMEKPGGYDTLIGERGQSLSGGQRQRLAIARAILRNAPILVLDEATSSLDTESERMVQSALEKLMQGRTTLCIAHRLSTIQNADLIVVMDEGRIVETGRHAELLAKDGVYAGLHRLQFRE